MGNNVIFKGSNGRLLIILNPAITFEELKDSLAEKLRQSKEFLMGYEAVIQFKGREISEDETIELLSIINNTVEMNILFIADDEESVPQEIEDIKNLVSEGITKFHIGTLRSGEILEYHGNIVIIGDVNPGSIVKAEGNIVVIGNLNGVAHAGIAGNAEAFIIASNMNPFQLKIDEILYKNYSNNILFRSKQIMRNKNSIAYLKNNILIIDKLTRKSLQNIVRN